METDSQTPKPSGVGSSALLADILKRLDRKSEEWRKLAADPHNINTALCVALKEVANVIEEALNAADDRAGIEAPISLPDVGELPKDVARKIAKLSEHEWTEEDWHDLLKLKRIVRHNLAVRHGLSVG